MDDSTLLRFLAFLACVAIARVEYHNRDNISAAIWYFCAVMWLIATVVEWAA